MLLLKRLMYRRSQRKQLAYRLAIYTATYKVIENSQCLFICIALSLVAKRKRCLLDFGQEFPEFWTQCPPHRPLNGAWFPINENGKQERLIILQNCIDSVKQQIKDLG